MYNNSTKTNSASFAYSNYYNDIVRYKYLCRRRINNVVMEKNKWSISIKPGSNLLNLNIKEILEYRDLIYLFVKRDFVTVYRQTVLGPLWHLIQPVLTSFTMVLVFYKIARLEINSDVAPLVYYMCAIIMWNFFAGCLNKSSGVFIQNASVFGKVYFPRITVPISYLLSGVIGFVFQFFFLFVIIAVCYLINGDPVYISPLILLTPVALIIVGLQGVAMGMIISSFTIKYRDLIYLVSFGIQLLMYISPVIYTIAQIPSKYQKLMMLNPMAPFIEMFRYSITGVGEISPSFILSSISITTVLLLIAIIVFNRTEKDFIDTI